MKYIKQMAKHNIYPYETSKEALKIVEKKKYNKIILISNVWTDLGGKNFISNERKIIGNDVIVLFLDYNISHLKWIKDYKNVLFSNNHNFYEYLQCFEDNNPYYTLENLKSLIDKMEKYYKVNFNIDENVLYHHLFKKEGKYCDLAFNSI